MQNLENMAASDLAAIGGRPLLLEVNIPADRDRVEWAARNAPEVERLLNENGALLIRGLKISDSETLGRILAKFFRDDLLDYVYRSTPRTKLENKVYTSSEYHPGETILLHNENSYTNRWPLKIAFCCIQSPEQGGQTPIADSREVFKSMPPDIVETFRRKGLMYVRNYGAIDLPWSEVFQTTDKNEVESYCRDNGIEVEWLPNDGLRTRQINPAIRRHPLTSEEVWFNAAHMFHISNLKPEVQNVMMSLLGVEKLPRNVCYADGSPIDFAIFGRIHEAYRKNKIVFDWAQGDLLLLDNMRFAHGREPFVGNRRVLCGMAHSSDRFFGRSNADRKSTVEA